MKEKTKMAKRKKGIKIQIWADKKREKKDNFETKKYKNDGKKDNFETKNDDWCYLVLENDLKVLEK